MRDLLRLVRLLPLLCLAGVVSSCNDSPPATTAPADLAPPPPDLACTPKACVAEAGEDCTGCFQHIGECCYGDRNWKTEPTLFNALVNACTDLPRCAACCNECKALSCAEIIRRGNCPAGAP